jgi:hypothetical protein
MPSRLVILIASLSLLAAACSDSTTITTGTEATSTVTADPAGSIVFGSGSIPETMPAGFPIPEAAVIGSTLIDRDRGLTEMVMRASADVTALTAFFETNLPVRGFTVDSSREEGDGRKIEFSGDDGSGTVDVTAAGQGVSQALVTFIDGS